MISDHRITYRTQFHNLGSSAYNCNNKQLFFITNKNAMETTEAKLVEKVVEYGICTWKLAIPCMDGDDDEDGTVRNEGEITNVIPIGGHLEHNIRITWVCSVERSESVDSDADKFTNVDVVVGLKGCSESSVTGYCKISIVDIEGTMLPDLMGYVSVDSEACNDEGVNFGLIFREVGISNNPKDPHFVRFELNIEIDEKKAVEYQRFPNDLCLLFDESLLTDSVIRVNGRELSVHHAIFAARWPRFYEQSFRASNDSVVDVGDVEPEAFEKLLRCIYSNINPTSLLDEETFYRDLAYILEPTWLKKQSTFDQQETSMTVPVMDLGELLTSDPDNIPEIAVSNHKSVTYRSFSYKTVITTENYKLPTFSLKEHITTVFPVEDDILLTAIWRISLKEFDRKLDCNYCQLKLILLNNADNIKVRSKFCIWNGGGQKQYEMDRFTEFILNYEQKFHLSSHTINRVGDSSLFSHLSDNDELTMCLDVDMQLSDLAGQSRTNLTDDLCRLLVDDHLSDVFLCVGDRKFPVHRAILAARSPVFRAMFTSNMKESVAGEIPIEDMEPDVMRELLRCVYTDQVPVECGCDMLIAFDRFGLISLFDRCQNSVTITVDNALEVFAVAEEFGAKRLKKRILKFLTNREIRTQGTMNKAT